MRKITIVVLSILVGFTVSAAQNDWEETIGEIRDELHKSMEEIQALKERLHGDGLPFFGRPDVSGSKRRASLGVILEQGNNERLMIAGFTPESNARESGVEQGDVLIGIDAQALTGESATASALIEYLETIEPGAEVILVVKRGDEELQYTVQTHTRMPMFGWMRQDFGDFQNIPRFEYRPPRALPNGSWFNAIPWDSMNPPPKRDSDVEVTDLNPELGTYFGVDSGILVLKAGDETALKAGDVIVAVGDQDVATSSDLYERLKDASGSVTVQRDGKAIELSIDETLEGLRLEREVRIFSRQPSKSVDKRVW